MGECWFVTGGARSGKSAFAEALAAQSGLAVVYMATMEALDDEMRARIERHRSARDAAWRTLEAPRDLLAPYRELDRDSCVIVDCLSMWVANGLLASGNEDPSPEDAARLELALGQAVEALLDAAAQRGGPTVIVSNEVGGGVVPPTALGRVYRDLLGRMNQLVSQRAARAWLLVAGRALELPPPAAGGAPAR